MLNHFAFHKFEPGRKHLHIRSLFLVAGIQAALACCATAFGAVEEVVIVFKTHFDIGYTDLASNVVQRYRTTMIDDALKVVDENRALPLEQQFAWTIPGWPASKILDDWPGQSSERQQRIRDAFRDRRFVVHALPFSTHTELLEPEDLVRGLGYSSRLARALGLELPRDAKMTDVPCHSWILPTLLRHAGIDFLHLGCNAASSSPRVPSLFWWEGPDGSRLLTMYSAAGYGTGLVPPADWPYHAWLALIQTGDNHGPPRPDEVAQLLAEAKEKLPAIRVRIGRLSDFSDALRREAHPIPVVRGDMPDTWIHGPMCDPAGARLARDFRPMIGVAETLAAPLTRQDAAPENQPWPRLAEAREQSLLYGEHTWGGALYWVTGYGKDLKWKYGESWKTERAAGRFQRLENSWSEHSAYIQRSAELTQSVLKHELESLSASIKIDGPRVVIYNPLPWVRDGLVKLPGFTTNADLKPCTGGARIPTWVEGDALCLIARDLPSCGYRTYQFVARKSETEKVTFDANARLIQSPYLRACLDPSRGIITSLIDRQTGHELVGSEVSSGFGQHLYERFDANNVSNYVKDYVKIQADWASAELGKPVLPPATEVPYHASTPADCSLNFERSASAVTAVMKFSPSSAVPYAVTTRLTLYRDLPFADLEMTLHEKPADPWPQAGWLCLPFNVRDPHFLLGRLGGIVNPARDFIPGSNHDLVAIHTGLALLDDSGSGVGLCPLDCPLVSLERPGCFRYTPEFIPRKPLVYVNLFNNQWSTNFRLWNEGTWTSRVRLWSIKRFNSIHSLITPALEARYPLLASVGEGSPGSLPLEQVGLSLSRKGVCVTAFGPDPDDHGLILRLWEYAGWSGPCRVQLPAELHHARVQEVDLRGRPTGSVFTCRDGSFITSLGAFAPASFRIETAALPPKTSRSQK